MKQKRKVLDHKYRLREFSDSIKHKNIHITEVPEEWEKWAECLFEQIIAENFPNLGKETGIQSKGHRELPSKSTNQVKKNPNIS